MHIILHKRCSHYTQNMHIILHILCILYAYNMRDSGFVFNQRLNNGFAFRLRWRRLFYKYSCCDTSSIDWSTFVWFAQHFPCQSFIICFMANHTENTTALTCIWCIRLVRTVKATCTVRGSLMGDHNVCTAFVSHHSGTGEIHVATASLSGGHTEEWIS